MTADALLAQLNVRDARSRAGAAREALRRIDAKEPMFDHVAESHGIAFQLGALIAHTHLLADAVDALLDGDA